MNVIELPRTGHVFHPGSVRALTPIKIEFSGWLGAQQDFFAIALFTVHGVGFSVEVKSTFSVAQPVGLPSYLPANDQLLEKVNQDALWALAEEAKKWHAECTVAIFGGSSSNSLGMFEEVLAQYLNAGDSVSLESSPGREEVCTIVVVTHVHNALMIPVVRLRVRQPGGTELDVRDLGMDSKIPRRITSVKTS